MAGAPLVCGAHLPYGRTSGADTVMTVPLQALITVLFFGRKKS